MVRNRGNHKDGTGCCRDRKTEGNTEAAKESEVLADGSEVELSFWYPISQESEANWYAMMVQKFNEEYAGKIKILENCQYTGRVLCL